MVDDWNIVRSSWWSLEISFFVCISQRMAFDDIIIFLSYSEKIIKHLVFVYFDEKQFTKLFCLIGTSDCFAILNVFNVSYWSWIQILNIWLIIIKVGKITTELHAPLSKRKAISRLTGKLEPVPFWERTYSL